MGVSTNFGNYSKVLNVRLFFEACCENDITLRNHCLKAFLVHCGYDNKHKALDRG